jgi:hypothetical protein
VSSLMAARPALAQPGKARSRIVNFLLHFKPAGSRLMRMKLPGRPKVRIVLPFFSRTKVGQTP